MLAIRASYDKKTLARQVIPLAPGYRTALLSRPVVYDIGICQCSAHQLLVKTKGQDNIILYMYIHLVYGTLGL